MKRLDRTRQLLADFGAEHSRGLDAAELAKLMGASRHNVSADLNQLWREGLVIKLAGRPVLFWDREVYDRLHDGPPPVADPFAQLIGAQESLRAAIEQAKAAVLYPPAGLHTLVTGPTGVGKSLLAESMHQFGICSGRLRPGAPFVTLNCADYAANPQLLMAHLFGAVKGAYTGLDHGKEGLLERADGGILFLDEVHRLPAEGQEMLFRLIDKGLFRPLGEAGPERQARVMLVAATTERVDSALLRTFTRRIPMVITLPSLAERTAAERLRYLRRFLQQEAGKIGIDILVPQESLRMLLEYECLGNIGQLKSDIQLALARLFLTYLTRRREPAELSPTHLPDHIHRSVPPSRHQSHEVSELLRTTGGRLLISKQATIESEGDDEPATDALPFSFYGLIEGQMRELQGQGLPLDEAERQVLQNIEGHFRHFIDQVQHRRHLQRQELSKVAGQGVLRAVERALLWAEERLQRAIPERVLYALALHVHAAREREARGKSLDYNLALPTCDLVESKVAAGVVDLISSELGLPLPSSDLAFVAMLLRPDSASDRHEKQVGVVIVAHGRVASAMVEVAHALAGANLAIAIDMELDEEPDAIQGELIRLAQQGRFPGGLLLLVDMGSLEAMGRAVTQETGLPVRTLGMVSTPLVVEAVHQASIPGANLEQVYHALLTARGHLAGRYNLDGLPQVILTFCYTGVGSAHTLARIAREALQEHAVRVEVIPGSIGEGTGWSRLVATLLRSHRLLAVVGPLHPQIPGIPFISTEELIAGQGGRRLLRLVEEGTRPGLHDAEPDGSEAEPSAVADGASLFGAMARSLGQHLRVTNPSTTVPVVARGLNAIEQYLGRSLDDSLRVGLTMHLACLVERKVEERLRREVPAQPPTPVRAASLPWLPEAMEELASLFHITFAPDELERLAELVNQSVLN